MRIHELNPISFLNKNNAVPQSDVIINYKENGMTDQITYKTNLEILGKSIATHLNLLSYNNGAVQTYTIDNETYGVTTVDINGKADKVSNVTPGNFAGLDNNGNLVDSGHKHSDYDPAGTAASTVTTAINDLYINQITNTKGKTISKINETAGKVNAEFQDIEITESQVTNLTEHLNSKLEATLKGANSGLAELDSNGKVPSSQLPSYVDDVLEGTLATFPATGEPNKIYVDTETNMSYRWSGTQYVKIASDLALGITSSTAYRGDYGNTAYTHATDSNRLTTAQTTSNLYKITTTDEGHISSATAATESDIMALHTSHTEKTSGLYKITVDTKGHVSAATAVEKSDITALGIPGSDTTYSNATQSTAGLMSAEDKTKLDGISLSGSISQMPMSPGTDGVYLLRATITNGAAVYDWVSAPNGSGVSF